MAAPDFAVTVASNAPELRRIFRKIARDQLPFASAVALTKLAQEGRDAGRDRLEDEFTVRSKRVLRGLSMQRAEKRDWPNQKAIVGHRDEFMLIHETGGQKRPERGSTRIAIPTRVVERTKTGRIKAKHRPRGSNAQKIEQRDGRMGRKRLELTTRRARKDRRRILFMLRRRVRIKPRFRLRATVEGVADDRYGPLFDKALTAAIRSARAQPGKFTSSEGRTFFNRSAAKVGL